MNRLRISVFVLISFVLCGQVVVPAGSSVVVQRRDALVLVITRSAMGKRAGNGFAIGDGTLVVTAHHLVFEKSVRGRHEMSGLVSVVSPYLGDGCEAEIIAADQELDLAVLRVPWKGHPALPLADASDIMSAERMQVAGMPGTLRSIVEGSDEALSEGFGVETQDLAIDFVAVRRRTPRFISLSDEDQLGDGWSGSPMLLPGSSTVAGCFTTLTRHTRKRGAERVSATGPAANQIRDTLKNSGMKRAIEVSEPTLPRAKDARDAFATFVRAYGHFTQNNYEAASGQIEEFVRLRPKSAIGYTLAAAHAQAQGQFDAGEQHFEKASQVDPNGAIPRILYAQMLSDRDPNKALEVLQDAWAFNRVKPTAALVMFNLLSEQNQYERCEQLLREALKVNSNNAYLWVNLGASHWHQDEKAEAVTAIGRAVELLPERGPFRARLAHLLEELGRLDEAEKHFRELTKLEPNNPVVHMWLAQFLQEHRPEAKPEALTEAQTALRLPPNRSLPHETIEQFIRALRSQIDTAP